MKRTPPGSLLALGLAALVLLALVSVGQGALHFGAPKVIAILSSVFGVHTSTPFAPWEATIVLDVRMPRIVTGAFVGAGLALSGAALQALFRNPLADPGVIGVASGGSLGAVAAMVLGFAARQGWTLPAFAIAGAALTAFSVYAVSSRGGRLPVGTLLLAGVALGSLASALTSLLLSLSLEEYEQGRQTFRWLMGGLEAKTWGEALLAGATTFAGSAVVSASARELDALLLGETQAASLGVDVPAVRRRLIFATSCVIGGAVAVSGVIAFVGLVVPHLLRLIVGPAHALLLPACFVFGAAFVVGCDLLCRVLVAPEELRLGIVTATLGAPFFLFLLLSRRKEVSLE